MKKKYMQPATLLITVAPQQMVCGSMDINGTTANKNDLLSRRLQHDNFDDEDVDF